MNIKEQVINKCWQYIFENFHKFNLTNQIKIALEICKKDLPTQLEGQGLGETKIVIIKDGNKTVEVPGRLSVLGSEVPGNDSGDRNGQDTLPTP